CTKPGQQLIEPERLCHVVVSAGVEGFDLVLGRMASGQHDDRHAAPSPYSPDYLDAVHVRQPEVQDHDVHWVRRRSFQGIPSVPDGEGLVAVRMQVNLHGTRQLRFVLHDQDQVHAAAPAPDHSGKVTTMVRPPPGVGSATRVPPIASVNPLATASPSPIPPGPRPGAAAGASSLRWNGRNMSSATPGARPGPWSTILSS